MELEKALHDYRENANVISNEEKVEETVRKSIEAFYFGEQERRLTYGEFLLTQLHLIRKRWWILQTLLLILLVSVLPSMQAGQFIQRILGVSASLFVILVIPELWKNRTNRSMEIESASFYSLRQIYAARILLFGIVDMVLISAFCIFTAARTDILVSQLFVQFLFPMTVTAAVCFGVLCSRFSLQETAAMMLCAAWSAIWLTVILNEKIYAAITFPLWLTFMGIALAFLAFAICRTLEECGHFMEVNANEFGIG